VKIGNTKATVAMVLGILSIAFCWLSILDLLLIVPAIVLGALARGDAKRYPERGGRGPATAGLVCGLIAFVLAASLTVYGYRKIKPCLDNYDYNSSSYNQCVHDRLFGSD
jgi:TM2 domain-containing membrane protein YozV